MSVLLQLITNSIGLYWRSKYQTSSIVEIHLDLTQALSKNFLSQISFGQDSDQFQSYAIILIGRYPHDH